MVDDGRPEPGRFTSHTSRSISCTAKGFCAAVGYSDYSDSERVFAETTHGAAWTGRRLAKPHEASAGFANTGIPGLSAVSCPSAEFCQAIGTWADSQGVIRSMSQTWNGKTWKLHPTAGDSAGVLVAISCRSHAMCMAVGSISDVNGVHPLAEQWDGSRWQVLTTVATYDDAALLTAVDCATASRCVAVGIQSPPYSNDEALAEQWSGGTKWKLLQQPPAPSGATTVALTGVDCPHTNNCMAVGNWFDASNVEHMLAQNLGSGKWSVHPLTDPSGSIASALNGVSCTSAGCTAVGVVATGAQRAHPVIEHWNGSTWNAVTAAVARRNMSSGLGAVSCHNTCVAAGTQSLTTGGRVVLIERN